MAKKSKTIKTRPEGPLTTVCMMVKGRTRTKAMYLPCRDCFAITVKGQGGSYTKHVEWKDATGWERIPHKETTTKQPETQTGEKTP